MDDSFEISDSTDRAQPAAINFEVINVDNCSAERHPKVCLNVVELRVALAMRFLDFTEINDRL